MGQWPGIHLDPWLPWPRSPPSPLSLLRQPCYLLVQAGDTPESGPGFATRASGQMQKWRQARCCMWHQRDRQDRHGARVSGGLLCPNRAPGDMQGHPPGSGKECLPPPHRTRHQGAAQLADPRTSLLPVKEIQLCRDGVSPSQALPKTAGSGRRGGRAACSSR